MRAEPGQRVDPRAKLLWCLTGALQALPILAGGAFGSYVLSSREDMPLYLVVLPLLGALVLAVLFVVVLPPLLWRRWRYEIRPMEVDLQRGHVQVTRTLVHGPGATRGYPAWTFTAPPGTLHGRLLHGWRVRTRFRD